MNMRYFIISIAPSFLFGAAASHAAEQPPETPTITVEAMREREALRLQIDHYVSHIVTVPTDGALAKWHDGVCPMVGGLSKDMGEYMLTKISTFARAAGVPLAAEKCKPNFAVLLAAHPDELIAAWSKHQRGLFGDADGFSVRRFKHANTAIRVWYNMQLETTDSGSVVGSGLAGLDATGAQFGGTQAFQGIPNVSASSLSRLQYNTAKDMQSVIILIDSGQAQNSTYGQIAAYIAMVGFAHIKSHFDTSGAPSILNLFTPEATPPPGLSAWDESFLKALYTTDQRVINQAGAIKLSVLRDLWH